MEQRKTESQEPASRIFGVTPAILAPKGKLTCRLPCLLALQVLVLGIPRVLRFLIEKVPLTT